MRNRIVMWLLRVRRQDSCVLSNGIANSVLIGSSKVFKFVSIFIKNKCWHSLNSFFACNVTCFIHIDLKNLVSLIISYLRGWVTVGRRLMVLTLRKTTFPSNSFDISSRIGAIILHGGHQVAKKSTHTRISWMLKVYKKCAGNPIRWTTILYRIAYLLPVQ